LTCVFRLVENDPITVIIHAPGPYVFVKATADGAAVENIVTAAPLISVPLRRAASGEARLVLTFNNPSRKIPVP
jgi:hypothetical protein